ncbi:MAG: hypothetical protein RLZZ139_2050, partial [Cyanobacteriota bacterium]
AAPRAAILFLGFAFVLTQSAAAILSGIGTKTLVTKRVTSFRNVTLFVTNICRNLTLGIRSKEH